jgi:hypothetical protein
MATTYNVPTESAEKLAVRRNSVGGASALEGERGVAYLKAPLSVSVDVSAATGGNCATSTTYYYFITRVTNGVESFGYAGSFTTGATTGNTYKPVFTITDIASNLVFATAATTYNLYLATTAAAAVFQTTTWSSPTLTFTASIVTTGTNYVNSPAMIAYPNAAGTTNANGILAYNGTTWVDDATVHNPNATTGYSGYAVTGQVTQVRQIRTSVVESQVYSRTATVTLTSGSGTVPDTAATWADFGKAVTLAAGQTGIPANAYVGTVTPGANFVLSSVQGKNVPYYPNSVSSGSPVPFVATASGSVQVTVTGSNVGPLPVQTGQYRTTRWQG